jgi:hypothetical protein
MATHSAKAATTIDRLRIATPCPISWEQMTGDSRVRFCGHCQLNVYNISELSRTEAEALIASSEGRICARLYRRTDGTILTKDCPVGLRALRMRVSKRAAAVFAAIASISAAAFGQQSAAKERKTTCTPQTRITRTTAPSNTTANGISGTVVDPIGGVVAGAKVTATNVETKEITTVFATDAGKFELASLAAGNYSITIEGIGFKTLNLLNVNVEKDKSTSIDVILETPEYLTGVISVIEQVELPPPGTTIIGSDVIKRLPIQ